MWIETNKHRQTNIVKTGRSAHHTRNHAVLINPVSRGLQVMVRVGCPPFIDMLQLHSIAPWEGSASKYTMDRHSRVGVRRRLYGRSLVTYPLLGYSTSRIALALHATPFLVSTNL